MHNACQLCENEVDYSPNLFYAKLSTIFNQPDMSTHSEAE